MVMGMEGVALDLDLVLGLRRLRVVWVRLGVRCRGLSNGDFGPGILVLDFTGRPTQSMPQASRALILITTTGDAISGVRECSNLEMLVIWTTQSRFFAPTFSPDLRKEHNGVKWLDAHASSIHCSLEVAFLRWRISDHPAFLRVLHQPLP
jgi:hypothetical protein